MELDRALAPLHRTEFKYVAKVWRDIEDTCGDEGKRWLGINDRFYLLVRLLGRQDLLHPWLFARCREVEAEPDGMLDLWARDHYKSTIITFSGCIQDILKNPEETIGLFSHTRGIAIGFLRQVKREFEQNRTLQALYEDILYDRPDKQSAKWSEHDGIIVKRKTNPKEATLEAWGLVDSQPTGKHFSKLLYDDIVTRDSVTTPEMMRKTVECLELSYNLGSKDAPRRFVGTIYHFNDAYKTITDRGTVTRRTHPATEDGTPTGKPVFISPELLAQKRRDMGPYTFAAQMLLNPVADESQGFKREWIRYHDGGLPLQQMNLYMLVDPASKKKSTSDYTSIWMLGASGDENFYVIDIVRDRLNLTQRCKLVMGWHRKYRPYEVRYEEYGLQADIEHIGYVQNQEAYRFDIVPIGGRMAKEDRIKRLVPLFERGRLYFPRSLHYTNHEGQIRDLVRDFIEEEYLSFPVSVHDDMLDGLARIAEPDLTIVWGNAVAQDWSKLTTEKAVYSW